MATSEDAIFSKAGWRIIPFLGLLYIVGFLDRVNVGFAALSMNKDLSFSPEIYGLGAGMFFFGYFLCEVPANLILEKVGARLWIFRIMLTWGAVSMTTALVHDAWSFYAVRFLLGVAEAGFFPGVILYLTYWFPASLHARFIALFMIAIPLANLVGAPVSGYILKIDALWGLHGWQWLFVLEGVPSLLLAFMVLAYLPDRPRTAKWLTPEEKDKIAARLAREPRPKHHAFLPMLADFRVWLLMVPDFGIVFCLYANGLWLPQIVKAMGFSVVDTGLMMLGPYLLCVVAMIAIGISSDIRGDRIGHTVAACLLAATGFAVAAFARDYLLILIALSVATAGTHAAIAVFWTLPPSLLGGEAAAGGIALINSFANLGGLAGPSMVGWLKQSTGGYGAGMAVLAVAMIASSIVLAGLSRSPAFRTFAARQIPG